MSSETMNSTEDTTEVTTAADEAATAETTEAEDTTTTTETVTATSTTSSTSDVKPPFMSDTVYSSLRWIVTLFIPALGTLYFSMAAIWDLPYSNEVVGTCTAIVTFMSVILKITENQYNTYTAVNNSGELTVSDSDAEDSSGYQLTLAKDLSEYSSGDTIILHVK